MSKMQESGWLFKNQTARRRQGWLYEGSMIDFRLGKYQDVLCDVECDALICDPPYSDRTHKGRRTGSEIRQSGIDTTL